MAARTNLAATPNPAFEGRAVYHRLNVHSRVELVHATSMGLTIELAKADTSRICGRQDSPRGHSQFRARKASGRELRGGSALVAPDHTSRSSASGARSMMKAYREEASLPISDWIA